MQPIDRIYKKVLTKLGKLKRSSSKSIEFKQLLLRITIFRCLKHYYTYTENLKLLNLIIKNVNINKCITNYQTVTNIGHGLQSIDDSFVLKNLISLLMLFQLSKIVRVWSSCSQNKNSFLKNCYSYRFILMPSWRYSNT